MPEGWSIRDDTEVARSKYLKAIKKLKPSFNSSMICINMENAGTSQDGHTVVSFKYKNKNYLYRDYWNGVPWIEEKERKASSYANATERLKSEKDFICKEIDKIDKKFDKNYIFYGLDNKVELENKKQGLVKALGFVEKALCLAQKKVAIEHLDLNEVIENAKNIGGEKQNATSNIKFER